MSIGSSESFGAVALLRNCRVPLCLAPEAGLAGDRDGLGSCDVLLRNGAIAAIGPVGSINTVDTLLVDHFMIDLDQGIVLPCFIESHTHLDKGHIWPRRRNPDGTFMGALDNVGPDRDANWNAGDLLARMSFSLRSAHAHGTAAIRTHLDSIGKQVDISWSVFNDVRAEWKDRIALQATALFGIEYAEDRAALDHVARTVRRHGGQLGPVPYMLPNLTELLDRCFRAASDNGLDLDFHVDETQDPTSEGLEAIADAALRHRFEGRILVGHCCSLARQSPETQKRVIGKLAERRISVVSLPMCNLYLQDRRAAGSTPIHRGLTLLHELKAAGVPMMVSSDNTRDPFYAYGDLDALEVFREAVRIGHLDHPFGDWISSITRTPAETLGVAAGVIRQGAAADLILFKARSYTELLSRPQSDRVVLRGGNAIDRTLPDYRELDPVVGAPY
jgi:cytosine/creatinine deaminase